MLVGGVAQRMRIVVLLDARVRANYSSWPNQVESWFNKLQRDTLLQFRRP